MAVSSTQERCIGPWVLEHHIGSGSFAVVWKAHHSSTGAQAAIKEINTEKLNRKLRESLASEISVLEHMKHKNVVCLLDIIKEGARIYIVLEFCSGGDLAHYIRQRGRVSEATARYLMQHLAAGLKELRVHNFIHRDLKPQNLLLSDTTSQPLLKIADFGFARNLHPEGMAETLCGSPLYMAPEILHSHKYDAKADLWSVGAILFELLVGKPPFNGANQVQLLRNIERYEAKVPEALTQTLSPDCLSLLHHLLRKNPVERMSFEEFFCHPFLALASVNTSNSNTANSNTSNSNTSNPSHAPATAAQQRTSSSGTAPTQNQATTVDSSPPPVPITTIHPIDAAEDHLEDAGPAVAGPHAPGRQAQGSGSGMSSDSDLMDSARQGVLDAMLTGMGNGGVHPGLAHQLHIIPPLEASGTPSNGGNNSITSLSDSFDKDYVLITNPYNPLPSQPLTSSTPVQPSSTPTRPRMPLGLSAHPAAALLSHRHTTPQHNTPQPRSAPQHGASQPHSTPQHHNTSQQHHIVQHNPTPQQFNTAQHHSTTQQLSMVHPHSAPQHTGMAQYYNTGQHHRTSQQHSTAGAQHALAQLGSIPRQSTPLLPAMSPSRVASSPLDKLFHPSKDNLFHPSKDNLFHPSKDNLFLPSKDYLGKESLPEAFSRGVNITAMGAHGTTGAGQDYTEPGSKEDLLKRMLGVVVELAHAKADAAEALSLHLLSLKLLDIVVRLQPRSTAPATDSFTAGAKHLLSQHQTAVTQLCTQVRPTQPLPDSSSLLYQWAILLSKDGATDELMGNISSSVNLYSKASDVFVFLALDWADWGFTNWQELPAADLQVLRNFHKALAGRIAACEVASSKPMLGF